jgi:radical SAM superfamily enzyme YgiQ (UPF0313 family)
MKRLKIILVIPPTNLYPLGFAYVSAILKKANYDFDIYGFFYNNEAWFKRNSSQNDKHNSINNDIVQTIQANNSYEYFYQLITKEKYDILLTGSLVGFFRWFYQILPQVKGYSPSSKIIMGGGITKDISENVIFEKLDVDYILKGEAETNLIPLLSLLSVEHINYKEFYEVPGLAWKDNSSAIRKSAPARLNLKKEGIILPDWDSFFIKEYIKRSDSLFSIKKTFFPILAGRGCPNVCAFCSPSIGRFASYSIDNIISEMQLWLGKYDFDFYFIYSEVAFTNDEFAREFCIQYKKLINKPWVGQVRTDIELCVDTYKIMKESGCMFLSMGFESANDRILDVMKKNTTLNNHIRNLEQAHEAGLTVSGGFVFGHYTETASEIRETFEFINKYDLVTDHFNGIAALITYPGTGYYKIAEKNGLISNPFKFLLSYSMKAGLNSPSLREYDESCRLNISGLSNDEFYNVVCTENIKRRRLYSKRHKALNVTRRFELGINAGFTFTGDCPICKNEVLFDSESYINPLNIHTRCNKCYYTIEIDIYNFVETQEYLDQIKDKIESCQKIVVFGKWIMDLIYCGALSIPYHKILAWVNQDQPEVSEFKYFYNIPQVSIEELASCDYDAIISLKPRIEVVHDVLANYGLKKDCFILHLFPDILNVEITKMLHKKKVALIGNTNSIINKKIKKLIDDAKCFNELIIYETIEQIDKNNHDYDFLIFDKTETCMNRYEFSQLSRYTVQEILYSEYLYDGGYFVKN